MSTLVAAALAAPACGFLRSPRPQGGRRTTPLRRKRPAAATAAPLSARSEEAFFAALPPLADAGTYKSSLHLHELSPESNEAVVAWRQSADVCQLWVPIEDGCRVKSTVEVKFSRTRLTLVVKKPLDGNAVEERDVPLAHDIVVDDRLVVEEHTATASYHVLLLPPSPALAGTL